MCLHSAKFQLRCFWQNVPVKGVLIQMCLQDNLVDCADSGGLCTGSGVSNTPLPSPVTVEQNKKDCNNSRFLKYTDRLVYTNAFWDPKNV